ncbi:MAG: hypothetical protein LBD46_06360 [Endomicrobium sp.]|jgi:hypothetical protein|nr:hypothetical protein [Endomicrobium sp.]
MNTSKEIEQRQKILEQADKLKSKGLILSKILEIVRTINDKKLGLRGLLAQATLSL